MDFKELNIDKKYIERLEKRGIKKATSIQEKIIPEILNNRDVIGQSKTGSGKTLAFLLPLLQKLEREKNKKDSEIQTLILAPTRELAIQIMEELKKIDPEEQFSAKIIYGGKGKGGEGEKTEIVIATPGRLIELLKEKKLSLSSIKTLVIDEADQMVLLGFKNELEYIITQCNKKRETLCFSATMNSEVKKISYRYTKEPVYILIEEEEHSFANIEQFKVITTDRRKIEALCSILNKDNPFMGIIFCRTKARVDKLDEQMIARGYSCQKIHSDIPQAKREKIMKSFKNLEVHFLIATDVVSRGIDVAGLTHVYNYDVPENSGIYTHRIGRTGRGKETGVAYTFLDPKDFSVMDSIEKELEIKIPSIEIEYEKEVYSNLEMIDQKYNKRVHVSSKRIEEMKNAKKRTGVRDKS
ncbi:MAG: DEAD/DEAH box helicase [Fusobacteriaceae bacterium]